VIIRQNLIAKKKEKKKEHPDSNPVQPFVGVTSAKQGNQPGNYTTPNLHHKRYRDLYAGNLYFVWAALGMLHSFSF
jgi:hypothetical protein